MVIGPGPDTVEKVVVDWYAREGTQDITVIIKDEVPRDLDPEGNSRTASIEVIEPSKKKPDQEKIELKKVTL